MTRLRAAALFGLASAVALRLVRGFRNGGAPEGPRLLGPARPAGPEVRTQGEVVAGPPAATVVESPARARAEPRPKPRRRPQPPPHPARAARLLAALERTQERRYMRHALPLAAILALAVWTLRRILFTSELPAGTDMFNLLARTRENADWDVVMSPWSPSVLGLPRQASLDNLLGLVTLITGDAVVTVKLAMLVTLFAIGAAAYYVVYRWYGSRTAALLAALLYMTSQASLGRFASGWLHYGGLIAAAPLVLYLWVGLSSRFTFARAIGLALVINGLVFLRQDMVLWLMPYLIVWIVVRMLLPGGRREALRNMAMTTAVVGVASVVLSLYLILPLLAGVKAPWLQTSQVFQQIDFNLIDRSLGAFHSLLGLGRDLGYLPFIGDPWWEEHPWMPAPLYYAAAAVAVALSYLALRWYRDPRTVLLVACVVVAAFLGKGIRAPLELPYELGVDHVPVFGSLRGPNRWLILQAFAYSALASITLVYLARRARGRLQTAGIALLVACMAIPVAPTVLGGLRTWNPSEGERALMERIERDDARFTVASVPYNQQMRFLEEEDGHRGYEHDLGVGSPLFTGHAALSGASWDRMAPDFVEYTARLLHDSEPAFGELLGSVGIKYLLRFNHPVTAEHLVADAEDRGRGLRFQQEAIDRMPGLRTVARTAGGMLYELPSWSPLISLRTGVGVALGGRSGLASFASLPGVDLKDWAVFTADDLLTQRRRGSLDRLTDTIERADAVLATNESVDDLAVLASPAVARVHGITSHRGEDRKRGLLLTDESARQGAMADQTIAPPPLVNSASGSFNVPQRRPLELWARVLASPSPGRLTFDLGGRRLATMTPLAPRRGSMRWVRVVARTFEPGRHVVSVRGALSELGPTFEVDEVKLIDPGVRRRSARAIAMALRRSSARVAYSLDLDSARYEDVRWDPSVPLTIGEPVDPAEPDEKPFWRAKEPDRVRTTVRPLGDERAVELAMGPPRQFYTVAEHRFRRPVDLRRGGFLLVPYRGTGSGRSHDLLLDSDRNSREFSSFELPDRSRDWRVAAIDLSDPRVAKRIHGLRVATPGRTGGGTIALGPPRLLFGDSVELRRDLPGDPSGRRAYLDDARTLGLDRRLRDGAYGDGRVAMEVQTRRIGRSQRIMIPAPGMRRPEPAEPVEFDDSGVAAYDYRARSDDGGVLVFNQGFDRKWKAPQPRVEAPVASLTNGFRATEGRVSGTLRYQGRERAVLGSILALAALAALVLLALLTRRRPRSWTDGLDLDRAATPGRANGLGELRAQAGQLGLVLLATVSAGLGSFYLAAAVALLGTSLGRTRWWTPAVAAGGVLASLPPLTAVGLESGADRLAVVVTVLVLAALIRLVAGQRRTEREPPSAAQPSGT